VNLVTVSNIGRTRYADAWRFQQRVWQLRHTGKIGDVLLFTEHEHVYTIGKGGDADHLLASGNELKQSGVDFVEIDRGGDVTYHGPGQIVGYPILDLNNYFRDLHRYLRSLEETLIIALREYGIEGTREEGYTGVWVKGEKIAAIGVKASRWVTMHGFALNVNTDLSKFERIIPCGIFHKGVTSMNLLLRRTVPLEGVHDHIVEAFRSVFGCTTRIASSDELKERVSSLEIQEHELARGVS
jgi:lipoyl(octanoyl) transferase